MISARALALSCVGLSGVVLCACLDGNDAATGIAPSLLPNQKPGPAIVFDPFARPVAEIPFPNDLVRGMGDGGALRLNLSQMATTKLERTLRAHMDRLEGFAANAAVTVRFEGPLDLETVRDDTVYIVNVEPTSKRYGELAALDLGRGSFPVGAEPHGYFPHDPKRDEDNFLLPASNAIDTDGDGILDTRVSHYEVATNTLFIRPLVPLDTGATHAVVLTRKVEGWLADGVTKGPIRSPFPFVNHEAQTPPLERALPFLGKVGVQRGDIAFAWTFTTDRPEALMMAVREGLYGRGTLARIATLVSPGWKKIYDTGITFDGNDSHPDPTKKFPKAPRDNLYVLQGPYLESVMALVSTVQPDLKSSFEYVDHFVFGSIETPNLRATPDHVFDVDPRTGKGTIGVEEVPFVLTVPKATDAHKPPFPVLLYAHGTRTSRIESIVLANKLARAGIATMGLDSVGHGPLLPDIKWLLEHKLPKNFNDPEMLLSLLKSLLGPMVYLDPDKELPDGMGIDAAITKLLQNGFIKQLAEYGRAYDDNGDGIIENGEAYFAPNAFKLRDSLRQSVIDFLCAVRVLRSLSQAQVPPAIADATGLPASDPKLIASMMAGDFDTDGVLDVGGPTAPIFMSGTSLGGIHTSIVTAVEPEIVAGAPNVPGAGLTDLFLRTKLHSVVRPIFFGVLGPVVVGCERKGLSPRKDDAPASYLLTWNDDSDGCDDKLLYAPKPDDSGEYDFGKPIVTANFGEAVVPNGATLRVDNLDNGERKEVVFKASEHGFSVGIPADKGDRVRLRVVSPGGQVLATAEGMAPVEGLGLDRNTPDLRRFADLSAQITHGGDPAAFARHLFLEPLVYPSGPAPDKGLLQLNALNDRTVPFATNAALARAGGLMGVDPATWKALNDTLLTIDAMASKASCPKLADDKGAFVPNDGPCAKLAPLDPSKPAGEQARLCTKIARPGGVSGWCIAEVEGHHEYIGMQNAGETFNFTEYHQNLIVDFLHGMGKVLDDDLCWRDKVCAKKRAERWDAPVGK